MATTMPVIKDWFEALGTHLSQSSRKYQTQLWLAWLNWPSTVYKNGFRPRCDNQVERDVTYGQISGSGDDSAFTKQIW